MELKKRAETGANEELRAAASRSLAVPSDVLVGAHYFNGDPASLVRIRKATADCIEALGPAR